MKRKYIAAIVAILMLLCIGCAANQLMTTKTVAEDTLYYSRVAYNLGQISATQFNDIQKTYDTLRVAQNSLIDAKKELLLMPNDATADQKYKVALSIAATASVNLTTLAIKYGILKDGGEVIEIPIRK
jgi:hypothetical protein